MTSFLFFESKLFRTCDVPGPVPCRHNRQIHLLTLPSMIRTKGEAGTGDVVEAVKHQRAVMADIRKAASLSDDELYVMAKDLAVPYHLLKETARLKRLPVVR